MSHRCIVESFREDPPDSLFGFRRRWFYRIGRIPYWHLDPVPQNSNEIIEFLEQTDWEGFEPELEWSVEYETWIPSLHEDDVDARELYITHLQGQFGDSRIGFEIQRRDRDYATYLFGRINMNVPFFIEGNHL